MKRVVITGMGIISPVGNSVETVLKALYSKYSGIKKVESWIKIKGLRATHLRRDKPLKSNVLVA